MRGHAMLVDAGGVAALQVAAPPVFLPSADVSPFG